MISKNMLENIVASEHGTIGYQTARRMARELLAARKVVEAARKWRTYMAKYEFGNNEEEIVRLYEALAAYDAAVKDQNSPS